jgi:uncharacterized protein YbjT (DUF2867 family)
MVILSHFQCDLNARESSGGEAYTVPGTDGTGTTATADADRSRFNGRMCMYAVTGITGKVGGQLAVNLIASGRPVRAVLRDEAKVAQWAAQGCEIALARMDDAEALFSAFAGAEAVFVLPPPTFDPQPGYPEARAVAAAVADALRRARPGRVLSLSTIGADAGEDNLLTQQTIMEEAIGASGLPVTFLRPAWFMENAAWDVVSARDDGVLHSFLQPADRPIPMVATEDIAECAARLIQEDWTGTRIVELEGEHVTPDDIADAFAKALGRPVKVEIVPRDRWENLFRSQGMRNPLPRIRMLDGFNDGWIAFRDNGRMAQKGRMKLIEIIAALVAEAGSNKAG